MAFTGVVSFFWNEETGNGIYIPYILFKIIGFAWYCLVAPVCLFAWQITKELIFFEILLHFLLPCTPMQGKIIIRKIAACLLFFVLIQKTGAGLFLHNVLHTSSEKASLPNEEDASGVSYACSCIDDFLAPFEEAEETVILHPPVVHSSPVVFYLATVSYTVPVQPFLRGPPADRFSV